MSKPSMVFPFQKAVLKLLCLCVRLFFYFLILYVLFLLIFTCSSSVTLGSSSCVAPSSENLHAGFGKFLAMQCKLESCHLTLKKCPDCLL